jgi:urease accessory protein
MNQVYKSRLPMRLVVICTFLLCAFPAEAHLNSTGMGPFYDGAMHLLMSPEDIVPVFAMAMLAGLRGVAFGRRALFVLPAAWLVGGCLGLTTVSTGGNAILAAVWFLVMGALLAVDAKLSLQVTTALAAVLGLYHGYLNGSGMGQPGTGAVALLGLIFTNFALIALAAAFVVRLRAEWARIGVRVAGSWIAASGLLMLGWAVRTA